MRHIPLCRIRWSAGDQEFVGACPSSRPGQGLTASTSSSPTPSAASKTPPNRSPSPPSPTPTPSTGRKHRDTRTGPARSRGCREQAAHRTRPGTGPQTAAGPVPHRTRPAPCTWAGPAASPKPAHPACGTTPGTFSHWLNSRVTFRYTPGMARVQAGTGYRPCPSSPARNPSTPPPTSSPSYPTGSCSTTCRPKDTRQDGKDDAELPAPRVQAAPAVESLAARRAGAGGQRGL